MDRRAARSTSSSSSGVSIARRGADYFGMSGPLEFIAAAIFCVLLVALNILNVLRGAFNSDEPAHLHVIWAWTRGLVQYRDVFSNNMPLFQLLCAPIVALLGERPTILVWMRFLVLPMYFVGAWCTYQVGTRLFSRRAGVWALLAVGFYGGYRSVGFEFRTDTLWTALWLLCISVLVGGAISLRRGLVAGLLFGFCFAVSMKSVVLLISLLLSAVLLAAVGREKLSKSWRELFQCIGAFLAMTALIPGVVMIFFAAKGVWRDFRYGVFDYNCLAVSVYRKEIACESHPAWAVIIFLTALSIVFFVARWIIRTARSSDLGFRRAFIFLICSSNLLALNLFWPPISRTYLPIYPLVFVLGSGALLALSDGLARSDWKVLQILRLAPLPFFVSVAELAFLIQTPTFWKDQTREEIDLLRSVLALTKPDDYIFDCKGETIFRRRCFRPVLERIEREQIRQGLTTDNAPERCIATGTCVVGTRFIGRFSTRTREFVEANYVPVTDSLRVAGAVLRPSTEKTGRFEFNVVIPARYEIISRDSNVVGTLDGTPYKGAEFLSPGRHIFDSAAAFQNLYLLWAQAVDRGFAPAFK